MAVKQLRALFHHIQKICVHCSTDVHSQIIQREKQPIPLAIQGVKRAHHYWTT